MYSGVSGSEFEADIFFGVVYYQRLRHMVSDKFQVSVYLHRSYRIYMCKSYHFISVSACYAVADYAKCKHFTSTSIFTTYLNSSVPFCSILNRMVSTTTKEGNYYNTIHRKLTRHDLLTVSMCKHKK